MSAGEIAAVVSHPWPGVRAIVADLRGWRPDDPVAALTQLGIELVQHAAAFDAADGPIAIVARAEPAPSGRASGSLVAEMAVSACHAFQRQLRYDRSWHTIPLVFVHGRDATDADLQPLVVAALSGGSAGVVLERSSGTTAGFGWERGDQP